MPSFIKWPASVYGLTGNDKHLDLRMRVFLNVFFYLSFYSFEEFKIANQIIKGNIVNLSIFYGTIINFK